MENLEIIEVTSYRINYIKFIKWNTMQTLNVGEEYLRTWKDMTPQMSKAGYIVTHISNPLSFLKNMQSKSLEGCDAHPNV